MPQASFFINLNAQEVQKYYRGQAQSVIVKSNQGLKIQFPANLILPYIGHTGVYGQFVLEYQMNGKAVSLQRV